MIFERTLGKGMHFGRFATSACKLQGCLRLATRKHCWFPDKYHAGEINSSQVDVEMQCDTSFLARLPGVSFPTNQCALQDVPVHQVFCQQLLPEQ